MGDRFDVQKNRARCLIVGEEIERIAEVDVGHATQRQQMREADTSRVSPVEHGGQQRARLGDEGDRSGARRQVREAGIDAAARHQNADTVRTDDAQQVGLRGSQHLLLQRGTAAIREFGETGRDHHRSAGTACTEFVDQGRHRRRRRRDDRQVGRARQIPDRVECGYAEDRIAMRIDGQDRSFEASAEEVLEHLAADRCVPFRRADQLDGARLECEFEVADGHAVRLSPSVGRECPFRSTVASAVAVSGHAHSAVGPDLWRGLERLTIEAWQRDGKARAAADAVARNRDPAAMAAYQ